MTPDAHEQRIEALFGHAKDLSADEQAAFLDEACRADPSDVRQAVERLLAADRRQAALRQLPEAPLQGGAVRLNCPHCHNPIELVVDREEEVVCPSCGSSFHLDAGRTQTWSKDKLPTLGKFTLLSPLGRGAFGTVYKAFDSELKRSVALKIPRSGTLAGAEDEDRIFREARNAAQLRHPGIVPVFDVGRSEYFPYIVSELVEGITLADALTGRRFSFREAAQLARQLALALDYSHKQGVVHRDLKPSNIMLTAEDAPRIMDFGLAKREAGEITMTIDGHILGTPAYMSPEQAAGKAHEVDGRSDVYSLGVILFELLTGELPFRGNPRMLLHQVLHNEPRTPRSLNDRVPRDLETICLKAMAKEPKRRYQSAAEFGDDLSRYLNGEPILARPVGRVERTWRWCRRNPAAAALLLSLVSGVLATSLLAVSFQAFRATVAERETSQALERLTETLALAQKEAKARRQIQLQAAKLMFEQGWSNSERGQTDRAVLSIARAIAELESLRNSVNKEDSASSTEIARLERSYRDHLLHLTLRSDFARLVLPHDSSILDIVFSPDGTKLATGCVERNARIWDVATGKPLGDALQHRGPVRAVAFSGDGGKLATASEDRTARIWDVATGKPLGDALQHRGLVIAVAFSPDGAKLATGSWDGTTSWDVMTGRPLEGTLHHGVMLAFSPDGATLVTLSNDGTARICDVATGKPVGGALQHGGPVVAAAFSPDGAKLATASEDGTSLVWDVATGRPLGDALQHSGPVLAVDFSPDGATLATASFDGTARIWEVATGRAVGDAFQHGRRINAADFSPDGATLATASHDATARIWDVATGKPLGDVLQHGDLVRAVDFSPDGTKLATAYDGAARIWDLATGKPVGDGLQHGDLVRAVDFSPDGTKLATASDDGTARIWDVATGKPFGDALQRGLIVWAVAFSPDGTKLATSTNDGARIWDLATGKWLGDTLQGATGDVEFSPDGTKLATACADGTARIWDVATGRQLGDALQHGSAVWAVDFSPDGTKLATASEDATARIWDVATGRQLGDALQHGDRVDAVAFSPDGAKLATASDGTRIWDVATGRPLGDAFQQGASVEAVAFSPDGAKLVTASGDETTLWDIAGQLDETAEDLNLWVEAMTGAELDDANVFHQFKMDAVLRQRDALERMGGPPRAWAQALERRRELLRKAAKKTRSRNLAVLKSQDPKLLGGRPAVLGLQPLQLDGQFGQCQALVLAGLRVRNLE